MELHCVSPERLAQAQALANRYGHSLISEAPPEVPGATQRHYWLELGPRHLALRTHGQHGAVYAEFAEEGAKHRREQGGGRGQPIAKAAGLKGLKRMPKVCDATAGLGRDSIVLAALGCEVVMVERSPVAAALLDDALARASQHPDTASMAARMHLVHQDSATYLSSLEPAQWPDVVVVDPMFPDKEKRKAAVKKDMQAFQSVIGDDADSARLLSAAVAVAKYRVVVKRPRLGPPIEGPRPTTVLEGESTRFDLYVNRSLTLLDDDRAAQERGGMPEALGGH